MKIQYPYIPAGRTILYVPATNWFMQMAKEFARKNSLDKTMPGAAVLVKDGRAIGIGANGSDYHQLHGCERVRLGCKTGEGYEFCEGCHPKNHSEPKAIADARKRGEETRGATLYLWGHWWLCQPCWDAIIAAGIAEVCLMEDSERLFNKAHPDNIVGRQFEQIQKEANMTVEELVQLMAESYIPGYGYNIKPVLVILRERGVDGPSLCVAALQNMDYPEVWLFSARMLRFYAENGVLDQEQAKQLCEFEFKHSSDSDDWTRCARALVRGGYQNVLVSFMQRRDISSAVKECIDAVIVLCG